MRTTVITPSEAKKISEAYDWIEPYRKLLNDVIESAAQKGKTFTNAVIKQEDANGVRKRLETMGYKIGALASEENDEFVLMTIDWTGASAYPSGSYRD